MKHLIVLVALTAACSSDIAGPDDAHESLRVDGALAFAVSDASASPGMALVHPSATVAPGVVSVHHVQYGSLCRYDVTGQAAVGAGTIELNVNFVERLTLCTGELRALTYDARISGVSGAYDLTVVHGEGARKDTLLQQRIIVP